MAQALQARAGTTVDQLIRAATAMALGGAAVIHLDTAGDHTEHAHVAAFFVALGVGQLAVAALVARRSDRWGVRAGIAATFGVIALWALSRTVGIPLVPDVGAVEPVGVKDAMATLLEAVALGAIGLLAVLPAAARGAVLTSPDRALGAAAAAVLLATVPGVVAGHAHEDGPGHGHAEVAEAAHGHDGAAESTASHAHDGEAHADDVSGRGPHELVGDDHTGEVVQAHAHVVPRPAAPAHGPGHRHGDGDEQPITATPVAASRAPTQEKGVAATVRYGPFTLPPASSDGVREQDGLLSNVILTNLPKPCENCYLTALKPNLVYADGREANYDTGAMLHHNVLAESWHDDPTCPRDVGIGLVGRRFFASGNERTGTAFPNGFGVFIDDSPWTGIFEIMNHRDTPQAVYFQLSVRYLPASAKLKPLTPVWLDVDNCEDSQFTVPAGHSVTSWDWTSTLTGRLVTTAGHVHDGGVSIQLSNATTKTSMCRSVAGYGRKPSFMGAIESMSVCAWDRIGTVRKGEELRISAVYDTPRADDHVMGIMMAFVYETDDLAGGTQAPRSMTHPEPQGAPPPPGHDH